MLIFLCNYPFEGAVSLNSVLVCLNFVVFVWTQKTIIQDYVQVLIIYKSTCWPKITIFHGCRARVSKSGICSSSGHQGSHLKIGVQGTTYHTVMNIRVIGICVGGQRMSNVRKEGNVLNIIAWLILTDQVI